MRSELAEAGKSMTVMRSEMVSASGGAGYWKDEASDSEVTREYYRLRQEDAGQPVDYDGNVTTTATAAATVTATATTTATHPPPSEMAMQTTTAVPTASETPTPTVTVTPTVTPSATPTITPTAIGTIGLGEATDRVAIRENPGENQMQIDGLEVGEIVIVYDDEQIEKDGHIWVRVKREENDIEGWVAKEYLKITP